MADVNHQNAWWEAPEGEVHTRVMNYVSTVEASQSSIYERFLKLAFLYDPYDQLSDGAGFIAPQVDAQVTENVVAANVDTVAAVAGRVKIRTRFMTDDGDWSVQRQARRLEWYADGLVKLYDVHPKSQAGFKDGAKFGTGIVKVWDDGEDIFVERVLIDEIIVDEAECRSTRNPHQIHQRKIVNREELKAAFPDFEDEIDKAHTSASDPTGRWWADYRTLDANQLVVIESWWLPVGRKSKGNYKPGRHTICIHGADLFDEEYEETRFPFAVFRWNERTTGWYGIGLAERIAGHQRQLNKLNWQIDRALQQLAVPTTYVRLQDAGIAVKATSPIGTIVPFKTQKPETSFPPAVSPEVYQRGEKIRASSFEESGVSRLAASAVMPAGMESAVAQREYKATTTERFAAQEQALEAFHLDIIWLLLQCCKRLGKKAPKVVRRSRFGRDPITWSDVDMGEVKVRMAAASDLTHTPAGREQTVIEWAQAGVIDQDEARRLLHHPDLERAMSMYTAALEDIERCIEEVLDGKILVPEPYQNLKMGIWRFQMAYLKARGDGAPEEILEGLRTWITQAGDELTKQDQVVPGTVIPGGAQVPPEMASGAEQPVSALAPQAMTLRPSAVPAGARR